MTRRKTQTETAMAARLESLDPATPRYGILAAAREFKASWVALGERLTVAREKETYAAWGYPSFEAYCRRELQIKQDTANKLTRSFSYLRDHEPKVLKGREGRDLPALDVVDLLSQAKDRTEISADAFDSIREQAMDPEARVTRAEIMKKFREADPGAFRPVAKAKEGPAPGPNDLRKALLLAERLQSVLAAQEGDVFAAAATKAAAVVAELKARFAAMEGTSAAEGVPPHRPGTPGVAAEDAAALH